MALQMSYTEPLSAGGTAHPAAYFKIGFCALDVNSKSGRLLFSGFDSAALAGEGAGVIGQKDYTLPPAALVDVMAIMKTGKAAAGAATTLYAWAYAYAKAAQDVDTGTKDANGNPVMASFFAGAQDV